MIKSYKSPLVFLSILSLSLSTAAFGQSVTEMIKRAEKLRTEAFEKHKAGHDTEALADLQEAADIVESPEYKAPNKQMMEMMITGQLTSIHGGAFQKKDWKTAEAALRKKLQFMEKTNKADTNDYQASVRMLNTMLLFQKKPTEGLQAKMKPLKEEPKN